MSELCTSVGFGHRCGEQVGVLVGGEERADDGVVEGLSGKPVGGARLRSVALAAAAGVVAVGGGASGGRGPGEPASAGSTDDQAGQQVLGAVGGSLGDVRAAFDEDCLCCVEEGCFDEWGMAGLAPGASEVDLAEVGAVA